MFKKILFFCGIIFFVVSISFLFKLKKADEYAENNNETSESYGTIAGEFLPCEWNTNTPEKVLSENNTQAIVINLKNNISEKCESLLSLRAPGFGITPLKEEQKIQIDASKSGSLSWILTPVKSGNYDITVSDEINTKVFGITVTNTFGLNVFQAKIFSILGTLFGPMFTIPWWWERLRRKKE